VTVVPGPPPSEPGPCRSPSRARSARGSRSPTPRPRRREPSAPRSPAGSKPGETDDQIRDYIAGIYGEDALLTPPSDGVAGLIWFLPVAGFVGAVGGLVVVFRRWQVPEDVEVSDEDQVLVEQARRSTRP